MMYWSRISAPRLMLLTRGPPLYGVKNWPTISVTPIFCAFSDVSAGCRTPIVIGVMCSAGFFCHAAARASTSTPRPLVLPMMRALPAAFVVKVAFFGARSRL